MTVVIFDYCHSVNRLLSAGYVLRCVTGYTLTINSSPEQIVVSIGGTIEGWD